MESFGDDLLNHGLRRELIATVLANAVVNRMGFALCIAMRMNMACRCTVW